MQKKVSIVFSTMLIALLLLTCITGVRSIGKDLYTYTKSVRTEKFLNSIDNLFSTVEKTVTNNFVLRSSCIDSFGLIQRIEGKTVVEDATSDKTVLKGDDGKLYFRGGVTDELSGGTDALAMSQTISSVIDLKGFCDDNGTRFLYVTAPHKYYSASVTLPESRVDYYDDTVAYAQTLTSEGIPNINLMADLATEEGQYTDGFFITDHHWNIRTAFWGFQKICSAINSEYGQLIDEKLYDTDSFSFETEQDTYLGSMGVRVGKYYAGMDDIDIISPEYQTDFKVSYFTKTLNTNICREGAFNDSILNGSPSYDMYITSDNALIHVENRTAPNDETILLIKDSFGVPTSAWLACCCEDLWIMDLRYTQSESVKDFVQSHNISTVIVMYNPEVLKSMLFYNFSDISTGQ